jgi:adenosylcobinamide-phosphate synthase
VAEAAFAAALDVRLGGVNDYAGRLEVRPQLGTGRPPELAHIGEACRLSSEVAWAVWAVLAGTAAAAGPLAAARRRRRAASPGRAA